MTSESNLNQGMGRPTRFCQPVADSICQRIAGGQSLRTICEAADMPVRSTVHRWLAKDRGGFRDQYARACEARAERYAEEIVEIADTEEDPQRARVRVDARKWVASKLLPRKYGHRVDVTSGGEPVRRNPMEELGRIADQLNALNLDGE